MGNTVRIAPVAGLALLAEILGSPDDAEAAARPDLPDMVRKAVEGKAKGKLYAGTIESGRALRELASLNEQYGKPHISISEHGLVSRSRKDGWTPEMTAEAYARLINDEETRGIPNFPGRSARDALWLPVENGKSLFAPVVPERKGMKAVTLYDPDTSKVERHLRESGYRGDGANSPYSIPGEGTRDTRIGSGPEFSAVDSRASLHDEDTSTASKVKGILPVTGGGLLGLLAGDDEAEAAPVPEKLGGLLGMIARADEGGRKSAPLSGTLGSAFGRELGPEKQAPWTNPGMSALLHAIDDKPLEDPVYSPIDLAVAPVGAAGIGAKAAAMAIDPLLTIGADYLMNDGVREMMKPGPYEAERIKDVFGLFTNGNY